ncbi:hypothetical protein I7X30_02515 [Capnocytophaga sp. 051621]|jgi:hypothetical protein|uniref:Uncharacterized protein n=1 Tax=Capnocytophaga periodontitidis TaxID=2795027 RepID=A0ABS0SJL2_9FLAO|nr:hypothetical protein [Capnocytophaga periodontitidis]MBI1645939.1 hypothetical protein [Capnocytophaga periodontitidis]
MSIDIRLKKVLQKINFEKRYLEICNKYSDFRNSINSKSISDIDLLLNQMEVKFKYSKKECFFKIEDKSNLITIGFNIIPYTGALQFVWSVKQNKQMLELSWGVWESILEEMLNKSFEIRPRPYYSNYQELEEILTEAFAIYEDFKTEVLKVDWEKESDL